MEHILDAQKHWDAGYTAGLEAGRQQAEKANSPSIGDVILATWPGHDGLKEFAITHIREDEDGIECAVFGEGGVVGAEAVNSLTLVWVVK